MIDTLSVRMVYQSRRDLQAFVGLLQEARPASV